MEMVKYKFVMIATGSTCDAAEGKISRAIQFLTGAGVWNRDGPVFIHTPVGVRQRIAYLRY